MHLCFMSGAGELGGAERSLLDILASLRTARPSWPLTVIAPADGPVISEAASLGATAHVLALDSALARIGEGSAPGAAVGRAELVSRLAGVMAPLADYRRRLRARLAEVAPDVIHTHGLKAHLLASWSNPGPGAVVWHLHDFVGRRRASASLLRHSTRRCAAIVANSASVAEDARAVLGGRVPIVPVLNAVDLQRFAPDGPQASLNPPSGNPPSGDPPSGDPPAGDPAAGPRPVPGAVRVGLVATFARWKGHHTFLDACARLPRTVAVHAYVVGGPLYQTDHSQWTLAELQAHAASVGLGDRVTFTGFIPASDTALRALDIVVHASTEPEPFGLVIAEAMACGRAVIAAGAGGAREIVTPGVDALVHEPGDATALAACIATLAADPERRLQLGRAARATAVRRFDRARLAGELLPVYERVAVRGSGRLAKAGRPRVEVPVA